MTVYIRMKRCKNIYSNIYIQNNTQHYILTMYKHTSFIQYNLDHCIIKGLQLSLKI
jgi:hypothetical protein